MTTIDELVVELKLDGSSFTAGQRKALDEFKKTDAEFQKRLKDLETTTKNTGFAFSGMTGAAEGLFTVLAGAGMASFARDVMTSAAATGRLATNIGITTKELSAFGMVIERNGGSADAAAASLKAYADTIQNWKWGKGSPEFLMGISQVGGADLNASPLEIARKLAKFAETHTAQETNQVGARLGMSQDIINSLIHGLDRFEKQYAATTKIALGDDQAKKLADAQEGWTGLGQAIRAVGTDSIAFIAAPFSSIAGSIADWIGKNRALADSLGVILTVLTAIGSVSGVGKLLSLAGKKTGLSGLAKVGGGLTAASTLPGRLIKGGGVLGLGYELVTTMKEDSQTGNHLRTWLRAQMGIDDPGEAAPWAGAKPNDPAAGGSAYGAFESKASKEAYIRAAAIRRGENPDIAMAVARAEGFDNFIGDGGTSFGSYQLHLTAGGRGHAVGDEFKRQTGLDPSDPRNERQTIDWALDWAKTHGWHDFHGAARVGVGDREGIGTVTIGDINVTTNSDNPREHGRLTADAIRNAMLAKQIANNANSGQRP